MMDKKKAADLLDNLIGMVEDSNEADYDTALRMGIEALMASGDGPEPVDDTISRQAAVEAVVAWTVEDRPDIEMPTDLVGRIESLPSAQPEPQWIPCSEPPTEHGFYHEILLYGKDGNYAVGWYDEDYFTWDDRFDLDTPIAWCKLPEPWRGANS